MYCPTLLECLVDYPVLILGVGMLIGCVINPIAKWFRPTNPYSAFTE